MILNKTAKLAARNICPKNNYDYKVPFKNLQYPYCFILNTKRKAYTNYKEMLILV